MQIGVRQLLTNANLHVAKGQTIGLVGRNGAGKTTLLKLLAGEAELSGAIEHSGVISRNTEIG